MCIRDLCSGTDVYHLSRWRVKRSIPSSPQPNNLSFLSYSSPFFSLSSSFSTPWLSSFLPLFPSFFFLSHISPLSSIVFWLIWLCFPLHHMIWRRSSGMMWVSMGGRKRCGAKAFLEDEYKQFLTENVKYFRKQNIREGLEGGKLWGSDEHVHEHD